MILTLSRRLMRDFRSVIRIDVVDVMHRRHHGPMSRIIAGFSLTVFCWQEGIVERNENLAKDYVWAVMLGQGDKERLMLELTVGDSGNLEDISWETLNLTGLTTEHLYKLERKATDLKKTRLEKAKQINGKVGRNDPCPCQSLLKYKKCCGR